MIYEELKIQLDLCDPIDVLSFVGRRWNDCWFVVCDEGDCHLFKDDGTEDDISNVTCINESMIPIALKKIIIPDSVTNIGDSAFENHGDLTNVAIPDNVTSIGYWAFSDCIGLTDVTIGNSVINIGDYAFFNCSNLTGMTIPDSVTIIGYDAFYVCNKLKSLVFKGKTMDEVEDMSQYPWGIKDESIITCI